MEKGERRRNPATFSPALQTAAGGYAKMRFFAVGGRIKLTDKIRRDWHYYAVALGLIFILNGVVGLLGFETQGWQSYAVGLVTWVISFWAAGLVIRRRPAEEA